MMDEDVAETSRSPSTADDGSGKIARDVAIKSKLLVRVDRAVTN